MSALVAVPLLPVIAMERAATYREMYDGLYSPGAYVIYKLVEEFVPQLVSGLVYCLVFYYTIALNGSFAVFWLVYVATTGVSMGCTLAAAAATPDPPVAGSIILPYMASWSFFNGYLIPFKSIPAYWQWYSIIDPLRYSFGAMMTNQFSSEEPEILPGITLLQFYDLENVNAWAWLGFETLFIPIFIFLFWAAMRWIRF